MDSQATLENALVWVYEEEERIYDFVQKTKVENYKWKAIKWKQWIKAINESCKEKAIKESNNGWKCKDKIDLCLIDCVRHSLKYKNYL